MESARDLRRAMRAKAHRMAQGDPHQKVDASSWTEAEPLNAGIKTGMRPVSRRAFKSGGKVKGADAVKHAGKKPRAKGTDLSINSIVNRDLKDANEEREGIKHVGGFRKGGRTGKASGGPSAESYVPTNRMAFAPNAESRMDKAAGLKRGGGAWEGSKKDEEQDRKLQKKYHIASKDFEKSAVDKKHDKQHSMKGLKRGGHADGCTCKMCSGGRMGKSVGGVLSGFGPDGLIGKGITEGSPIKYLLDDGKDKDKDNGKKRGGSVSDGEIEGTRPTGGRLAKKQGGSDNWIQGAIKHPGALHRELHVPEGKKIPAKKMAEAAHSDNPHIRRQAALAKTLKRVGKAHGGSIADLELASGGRAKKKSGDTDITIVIGAPPRAAAPASMPMPAGGPPMPPPAPARPPMPPAMPIPAGGPPMPPGGPMPLARKLGGRIGNKRYYNMDGGAGSGLGRLEKIEDYGKNSRD